MILKELNLGQLDDYDLYNKNMYFQRFSFSHTSVQNQIHLGSTLQNGAKNTFSHEYIIGLKNTQIHEYIIGLKNTFLHKYTNTE